MLKKFVALILGCIFLFVTPIIVWAASDSEIMSGTHTARVIVARAIVYSDENMNSPLGYISNGKLITVGNPRKKNPDLVPLLVYGRLAFIESKNIHFENESVETLNSKRGAPREHNIDIVLTKPEEKLSENNSAYFSLQRFGGGEDTKNLFNNIDGSSKENYLGYGISLIHRQLAGRVFWGAGYEYNTISNDNISFNLYMLRPIIGYTPIKTSLFLVDLIFSLDFSISAQLDIKNNTDTEPSGFAWGSNMGARMVFFPENKYHLYGGLAYRSYKVLGIESVFDSNEKPINGLGKINGFDFSIGFAVEI
ncbi:MAG: hypothetical protein ACXVCE_10570 [Bacteriovorax sp.]